MILLAIPEQNNHTYIILNALRRNSVSHMTRMPTLSIYIVDHATQFAKHVHSPGDIGSVKSAMLNSSVSYQRDILRLLFQSHSSFYVGITLYLREEVLLFRYFSLWERLSLVNPNSIESVLRAQGVRYSFTG